VNRGAQGLPLRQTILRAVGVLLLVAAILKAQGFGVTPVSALGWLSAAWIQVGLIEAEVLLACWLISGKAPLAAWLVACMTFSMFAGVAFFQAWIGRATCGCFGRLALNPWYAFLIDLGVLAALGLGHPELKSLWREPRTVLLRPLTAAAGWFVGGAVVFAVLGVIAVHCFGSFDAALAHLRGERIAVQPHFVDVGTASIGELHEVHVRIANYTEGSVRLLGGTSDCSCVVTKDLPMTIRAGEAKDFLVELRHTGAPGFFTRTARLLTDDAQSPVVWFRLTGRNLATPAVDAAPID
jgi:hypothetical protein